MLHVASMPVLYSFHTCQNRDSVHTIGKSDHNHGGIC